MIRIEMNIELDYLVDPQGADFVGPDLFVSSGQQARR
jgi:hypothetical protein